MNSFKIDLKPDEQSLLEKIEFDINVVQPRGTNEVSKNANLAADLAEILMDRNGVPAHRLRYFSSPDYNVYGLGKSHQQVFESNGNRGRELLKHPNYLGFLRYFIFGANLEDVVRDSFKTRVENCGFVTSGDESRLGRYAKKLIKEHELVPSNVQEEFYKLALDCGIDHMRAKSIRKAIH